MGNTRPGMNTENSSSSSADQKSTRSLLFWGCVVAVPLMIVGGSIVAIEKWNEGTALKKGKLAALVVPYEEVQVDFAGAKVLTEVTRGKSASRFWTALETKNWLLINGKHAGWLCAPLLQTFGERNPSPAFAIRPETMEMLASAFDSRVSTQRVFIPRFTEKPSDGLLRKCPGFTFDEVSKTLKVGSRTVALLAGVPNPALAAAPQE